jgi:hypothetical protein
MGGTARENNGGVIIIKTTRKLAYDTFPKKKPVIKPNVVNSLVTMYINKNK